MLKQRIITGVVLAVGLLSALWFLPDRALMVLLALVLLIGAWEWAGLSGLVGSVARVVYVLCIAAVLLVLWWASQLNTQLAPRWIIAAGGVWWLLALVCVTTYPASARIWGKQALELVIGALVLVPALFATLALIQVPQGRLWVLFVVLVVASADIGAFFAGRRFGRRRLAAKVSPGKTLEGLVGGLCSVALLALVCAWGVSYTSPGGFAEMPTADWLQWLLVVLITGLASVLGDLNESMVKRHRGIKDSGTILPGHGGVLDRVDSLSAALPVFVLLVWVFDLIALSV
ncbi:MAG: phosphatidate cytidylyltransferase [Porticoccaceae bacterium]